MNRTEELIVLRDQLAAALAQCNALIAAERKAARNPQVNPALAEVLELVSPHVESLEA